eukprot:TRINITY_DN46943_c0_g1_i1.p1 TRINITY_DN46943_c0_g1~~TRINITY_DN46943_c0_g1_i1.p1  ORF type:complete len:333 (+),score=107.60 TRINITY_DN46943_c0_g1_i1:53-1051(+)
MAWQPTAGPIGVVLDVDGVLILGGTPIPGAADALRKLKRSGVPYAMLTNGGSVPEAVKAGKITRTLGEDVPAGRTVLSHTPMRYLEQYKKEVVVVAGPRSMAPVQVLREYGFEKVVSVDQLITADVSLRNYGTRRECEESPLAAELVRGASHPAAFFILEDPEDWQGTIQIIIDANRGTLSEPRSAARNVPVFLNNPDVTTPQGSHSPRLTVGAFRRALQVVAEQEKVSVEMHQYGKPHEPNYRMTERVLRAQLGRDPAVIIGIGDNPKSDIAGANAAGSLWRSCLVRTGVWRGEPVQPAEEPDVTCDSIVEAIDHIVAGRVPAKKRLYPKL